MSKANILKNINNTCTTGGSDNVSEVESSWDLTMDDMRDCTMISELADKRMLNLSTRLIHNHMIKNCVCIRHVKPSILEDEFSGRTGLCDMDVMVMNIDERGRIYQAVCEAFRSATSITPVHSSVICEQESLVNRCLEASWASGRASLLAATGSVITNVSDKVDLTRWQESGVAVGARHIACIRGIECAEKKVLCYHKTALTLWYTVMGGGQLGSRLSRMAVDIMEIDSHGKYGETYGNNKYEEPDENEHVVLAAKVGIMTWRIDVLGSRMVSCEHMRPVVWTKELYHKMRWGDYGVLSGTWAAAVLTGGVQGLFVLQTAFEKSCGCARKCVETGYMFNDMVSLERDRSTVGVINWWMWFNKGTVGLGDLRSMIRNLCRLDCFETEDLEMVDRAIWGTWFTQVVEPRYLQGFCSAEIWGEQHDEVQELDNMCMNSQWVRKVKSRIPWVQDVMICLRKSKNIESVVSELQAMKWHESESWVREALTQGVCLAWSVSFDLETYCAMSRVLIEQATRLHEVDAVVLTVVWAAICTKQGRIVRFVAGLMSGW